MFVCKYHKMKEYDCPVTVRVLSEPDGGVAVQLPDPDREHDLELKGERTYAAYLDAKGTFSHQNYLLLLATTITIRSSTKRTAERLDFLPNIFFKHSTFLVEMTALLEKDVKR